MGGELTSLLHAPRTPLGPMGFEPMTPALRLGSWIRTSEHLLPRQARIAICGTPRYVGTYAAYLRLYQCLFEIGYKSISQFLQFQNKITYAFRQRNPI